MNTCSCTNIEQFPIFVLVIHYFSVVYLSCQPFFASSYRWSHTVSMMCRATIGRLTRGMCTVFHYL